MRGFYRGCATNLIRTTPAAALTFTSFELISRALKQMVVEKEQAEADALIQARQQQQQQGGPSSAAAAAHASSGQKATAGT